MSHIIEELLLDCSTPDRFCFSLSCRECGETWHSTASPFSRAGIDPCSEEKQVIFDILFQKEKTEALERAVAEASKEFNLCPICRRLVCDHCFMICEDLDMCVSCAERLKETGECVAPK